MIECSTCGSEYDDQFIVGSIGMIPVAFCITCANGIFDMVHQLNPCDCKQE